MAEQELTEELQNKIIEIYNKNPDLTFITQSVFQNADLDGRSKEGRAVRKFLTNRGLTYKTTVKDAAGEIVLTDHHKSFILQNAEDMTAFAMAKVLFPEASVVSTLSKEPRAILDFLREAAPEKIKKNESGVGVKYSPPSTVSEAVARVNAVTIQELFPTKLTAQNRQNIAALIRFINAPRVVQIINNYSDKEDRELFESEFVRFTWDKPDLTNDEITLYINLCQDVVTNKRLVKHIEQLNVIFEEAAKSDGEDGDNELTVRLAETMKAKTDEYDKVQKRIESLIKKLNGDRATRLQKQTERTSNFLAIVEAFQIEEERKRLLLIAKARRESVKNEADRLESLGEFQARIMGISKEEAI